jgi:hypothetical protein
MAGPLLSDEQGRDLYLRPPAGSGRTILLTGWLKNHNNQFADYLNYSYGPRQHVLVDLAQNGVHSKISVPANSKTLSFMIKGLSRNTDLSYHADPFWEKLCRYPARAVGGGLVVLVDASLKGQMSFIHNFFDELLSFQPRYFFKEPSAAGITCSVLLYICAKQDGISVQTEKKFRQTPYLVIGVKQGIEQLKHFTNSIEFTPVKINTMDTKR